MANVHKGKSSEADPDRIDPTSGRLFLVLRVKRGLPSL